MNAARDVTFPKPEAGRLTAAGTVRGEVLELSLSGTAETPEEPHLARVLKKAHDEAQAIRAGMEHAAAAITH